MNSLAPTCLNIFMEWINRRFFTLLYCPLTLSPGASGARLGHAKPHYTAGKALSDVLGDASPVEHANFIGECFPGPFAYDRNLRASKNAIGYSPLRREEPRCNA